jgi:hypothetical protein
MAQGPMAVSRSAKQMAAEDIVIGDKDSMPRKATPPDF